MDLTDPVEIENRRSDIHVGEMIHKTHDTEKLRPVILYV